MSDLNNLLDTNAIYYDAISDVEVAIGDAIPDVEVAIGGTSDGNEGGKAKFLFHEVDAVLLF
jgi:hypothetical protein